MNFFDSIIKMSGWVEIEHRDKDGNLLNERRFPNVVTQSGRALAGKLLIGTTATAATYLCLGSNATTTANSCKTIAEHTNAAGGLGRTSATVSMVGISTAKWAFTWTCGSDGMIVQEEAIAHQASVANAELVAMQTFASITVNSGDNINVSHYISIA
jgi:hypothetical protein